DFVRAAARRLLGQARPDAAEPPGLGRRRPVPLGDLLPRRRAAGGRAPVEGRAAEPAQRPRRHRRRAGADLLSGRGLPPAVPGEARAVELHARPSRDRVTASRGVGVLATLGAAALLCACGSASAGGATATKTVSEADKGRTISVGRGTHIVLRLHNTYWRIRGSSAGGVVRQTGPQKVVVKSG